MDDDEIVEIEVASILLQLPELFPNRSPFSWPVWGSKRRRSAEEHSIMRRFCSPSPLLQSSLYEIAGVSVPVVVEPEKSACKIEAATTASPDTPLSFNPSESDAKPKRLKTKLSISKKKEELIEIEKECTVTNESLRKEIEQARQYLKHLEAQNMSLQARKQELIKGGEKEKQKLRVEDNKLQGKVEEIENEQVGASGILDLNVSLMDFVQFDNKSSTKAMAAKARYRRMLICRNKNLNAVKSRFHHR